MSRKALLYGLTLVALAMCGLHYQLAPEATAGEVAESCRGNSDFAEVTVTIDLAQNVLGVDKESVTVHRDASHGAGKVCWVLSGLEGGYELHIESKGGQEDRFPNREKKIRHPRDFAKSGSIHGDEAGRWEYGLRLTREKDGETIIELDPEVIINGEPSH